MKIKQLILFFSITWGCLFSDIADARPDLWISGAQRSSKALIDIPSLSPLVKARESSVLVIFTESDAPVMMPLPFPFGRQRSAPTPRRTGQGSGFIIHPHGYALTNHHVVEGATRIIVKSGQNPEEIEAEIIGSDANTDIALLKLQGNRKDWPVAPLGDSDRLNIGDFVVAIGNPFGLEMSVSLGIVSARGRNDVAPSGRMGLYDFLQTDASINPGNSGGPLLNLKGEVIGINAAVNTAGQGIGFAIPINMVKRVASDLKDNGRVVRSYIGVTIDKVTPDLASSMGLNHPHGALVRQVAEGSPADKAGLEPGDIITHFGGKKIESSSKLPVLAGLAGVNKKVKLKIIRNEKPMAIKVKLAEMPGANTVAQRAQPKEKDINTQIGVAVQDIDANARRSLKIPKSVKGALIVEVRHGSKASFAGLRRGDVITKVNGRVIKSSQSFLNAIKKVASGKLVRLMVRRKSARLFIAVKKP